MDKCIVSKALVMTPFNFSGNFSTRRKVPLVWWRGQELSTGNIIKTKNLRFRFPTFTVVKNKILDITLEVCNSNFYSNEFLVLEYVVVRPYYNLLSTTSTTGTHLGANHKFTWVFVTDPDSTLQLSFDFINTERHYDFVTVGEGSNPSDNLLLTWSGEERNSLPTVTSSTFTMWLTLTTDESRQATDSFSANLTQIRKSQGMF